MRPTKVILLVLLITWCCCQYLIISHPSDLAESFRENKMKVVSSPIGFKPNIGSLHGRLKLAQPISACSELNQIEMNEDQDIFIMADDQGCLQSMKAHNIASSGAYIGIIKRNINNTLHDKTVDLVHIPILEIEPNDYDNIVNYMNKNVDKAITLIADFNGGVERKKINIELWMSPTQDKAYQYILNLKSFIKNQRSLISFTPRFVLHSQTNRKQYIGCYSSGRYCPPDLEFEGKPEGSKIVGQSLRQMLIAARDDDKWFDYANYFSEKCLKKWSVSLWQQQNSQLCSQSAMMSTGIDPQQIFKQYNKSFQGNRAQVDGNIVLQEERQAYITQKIITYPILFINGRQYSLQDPEQMQLRICTMIHPDPTQQTVQCQKITNPPVFTTGEMIVGIGILISVMVFIMCICKQVIYRKMKDQMRGEVDKTLSQYYNYMKQFDEPDLTSTNKPNYMETLQQPDHKNTGKVPLVGTRSDTNQVGSVELTEYKGNK